MKLVDSWSEVVWIPSECDIKRFQKLVHSNKKILRPKYKQNVCQTHTAITLIDYITKSATCTRYELIMNHYMPLTQQCLTAILQAYLGLPVAALIVVLHLFQTCILSGHTRTFHILLNTMQPWLPWAFIITVQNLIQSFISSLHSSCPNQPSLPFLINSLNGSNPNTSLSIFLSV